VKPALLTVLRSAVVVLAALLWTNPAPLYAQALYGSITGQVVDDSGAAIPGVTVTATHQGTGLEVNGVSDDGGNYTFRNLQPGRYSVKASLQGFKEFQQTNVPVEPNNVVRVNAKLEVGALSEQITVTTEVALLKTDKADVSVNLRPEEVVNLPLNQYRNYQALMNLVPGATPVEFQNAQTDTPGRALSTNVNGTNRNNNVTRVDGAASINVWLPHHAGYIAPAETIETVNISTNSFDASQGMTGGAAVSVQTKSGTNELKGSAFYFTNRSSWNARQNFFSAAENPKGSVNIGGGTVGGPIKKNRLFFFGGWERNLEKNSRIDIFSVPTAKMRNGDFSEVPGASSTWANFRLFDPASGTATNGSDRSQFPGLQIPTDRISPVAQRIQALYPMPNRPGINGGLTDNYEVARFPVAKRDNYDAKINWNRTSAHQIWGKFSTMKARVDDLYYFGVDGVGGGDTTVKVFSLGSTYTLTPTLLWDATFGYNGMNQFAVTPDLGTNFGLDVFGIPGTNSAGVTGPGSADLSRYSGMPRINTGLSGLGNDATWTPVWRDEVNYTFSTNVTKVQGAHEIRAGFDYVKLGLDHWQPEIANPRGNFDFSGNITGQAGYTAIGFNNYAAFLLGQFSAFSKSVQFEEMSGREDQYGLYVNDRWQVNNKLTLNFGLRYEYYPLMTRANRGLEQLDLSTFNVRLGGLGGNPEDLGIEVSKTLFAPRAGFAYRMTDNTVLRAGYGRTFNPLPWSRPLRGFYPLTIAYSGAGAAAHVPYGSLANGIPGAPNPDINSGNVPLPRGVDMRWADPNDVKRGTTDSWNAFIEHRFPLDVAISVGYVGTATNGSYRDWNQNWAESGGNANRQYFAQAGTAALNLWQAENKNRYHSLQVAVNRPMKNGLLLKGAYTLSKAENEADDDGWVGLSWNQPSQLHRNYALAGYDRTHMIQLGFVYELPFMKESTSPVAYIVKDWQINGIASWLSGRPFTIGGDNAALDQVGGTQTANLSGEPGRGFGDPGPNEQWYDPSGFSQPGNAWGNTGRNQFRGPGYYGLDMSLFRNVPVGKYRFEFRAEAFNILNHVRWGNPVTGLTDPNFMRIRSVIGTARRVQLGLRFQF
jgi:outer membrane receptor protein involved in Fe transport